MTDAADHLRAAADDMNDAGTSLRKAIEAADESADVIDRVEHLTADLESTLRQLAINTEVLEADD
jgi:chemotaxis regulatin CheY-phosphate phosphatase CheZ